jgi:uncharacterized protein (DUF1330 family)
MGLRNKGSFYLLSPQREHEAHQRVTSAALRLWAGRRTGVAMPAYIVATVTIADPEKFAAYGAAIKGLAEEFGGQAVVKGAVAQVLEGDVDPNERVVVTQFPDAESAKAYVASDRYRAGVALRGGAADAKIRLLVD